MVKQAKPKETIPNNVLTQTSALGKINVVEYNANDLVKSFTPYGLNKVTYTYDTQGRVTQTKQGNRKITYTYDARGNLSTTKDALGRVVLFEYDSRDRVIKTIYPNKSISENIYDKNGNMTTLRTPRPSDHTFTYNGVNKRTSMKSPLGFQTSYGYDKQRRITSITRPQVKVLIIPTITEDSLQQRPMKAQRTTLMLVKAM
jgi:YD repeat-containing protein